MPQMYGGAHTHRTRIAAREGEEPFAASHCLTAVP